MWQLQPDAREIRMRGQDLAEDIDSLRQPTLTLAQHADVEALSAAIAVVGKFGVCQQTFGHVQPCGLQKLIDNAELLRRRSFGHWASISPSVTRRMSLAACTSAVAGAAPSAAIAKTDGTKSDERASDSKIGNRPTTDTCPKPGQQPHHGRNTPNTVPRCQDARDFCAHQAVPYRLTRANLEACAGRTLVRYFLMSPSASQTWNGAMLSLLAPPKAPVTTTLGTAGCSASLYSSSFVRFRLPRNAERSRGFRRIGAVGMRR